MFQNLFVPGRDVSVDEAMIKYKGRSSIKQYMPNKPIKRGFNIWMLADSETGYALKFSVYKEKTGDSTAKGLGAKVVKTLTEDLHNRYHHVYFDNFFLGIDLMVDLLKLGTYGCGTMRNRRKGFLNTLKQYTKKVYQTEVIIELNGTETFLFVSGKTISQSLCASQTPQQPFSRKTRLTLVNQYQ